MCSQFANCDCQQLLMRVYRMRWILPILVWATSICRWGEMLYCVNAPRARIIYWECLEKMMWRCTISTVWTQNCFWLSFDSIRRSIHGNMCQPDQTWTGTMFVARTFLLSTLTVLSSKTVQAVQHPGRPSQSWNTATSTAVLLNRVKQADFHGDEFSVEW